MRPDARCRTHAHGRTLVLSRCGRVLVFDAWRTNVTSEKHGRDGLADAPNVVVVVVVVVGAAGLVGGDGGRTSACVRGLVVVVRARRCCRRWPPSARRGRRTAAPERSRSRRRFGAPRPRKARRSTLANRQTERAPRDDGPLTRSLAVRHRRRAVPVHRTPTNRKRPISSSSAAARSSPPNR